MNDTNFINGLFLLSEDKGKRACIRRVFNKDSSRVRGLGILAQLDVPNLSTPEALPYEAVAFLFGAAKNPDREAKFNLGYSLKMAVKKSYTPNENNEYSYDTRFNKMVSCSSIDRLVSEHLVGVQKFLEDTSVNYYILLEDLKHWNKNVANRWISGYYSN